MRRWAAALSTFAVLGLWALVTHATLGLEFASPRDSYRRASRGAATSGPPPSRCSQRGHFPASRGHHRSAASRSPRLRARRGPLRSLLLDRGRRRSRDNDAPDTP